MNLVCKVGIYTYSTQKRNYFQFFLDCLSLSHHMVAFFMPYNLSKYSQARMREVEMSLYRNM